MMQAIEHEGKQVKVIVLIDESIDHNLPNKKQSINDYAGKISLSLDALEFQKSIRDEWA